MSAAQCLVAAARVRGHWSLQAGGSGEACDPELFSPLFEMALGGQPGAARTEDLQWLSSSMHNLAADFSQAGLPERTIVPLRVAWEATRCCAVLGAGDGGTGLLPLQMDLARRAVSLGDSLRRLGHQTLGLQLVAASLATLCTSPSPAQAGAVRPLVRCYVRLSLPPAAPSDSLVAMLQQQAPGMSLTAAADVMTEQLAALEAEAAADGGDPAREYAAREGSKLLGLLLGEVLTEQDNPVRRARVLGLLAARHAQQGEAGEAEECLQSALDLLAAAERSGECGRSSALQQITS